MSHSPLPSLFVSTVRVWPAGAAVWHRATGKRGLVVGWQVTHTATAFVVVDWGNSSGCEYPLALSRTPVVEGGAGEEWKEAAV